MSKNTDTQETTVPEATAPETATPQDGTPAAGGMPDCISELLARGTALLTAKTREGLAELIDSIPADIRYSVGAAGHDLGKDVWTLRVDLTD